MYLGDFIDFLVFIYVQTSYSGFLSSENPYYLCISMKRNNCAGSKEACLSVGVSMNYIYVEIWGVFHLPLNLIFLSATDLCYLFSRHVPLVFGIRIHRWTFTDSQGLTMTGAYSYWCEWIKSGLNLDSGVKQFSRINFD